jgi:hypothetical protein
LASERDAVSNHADPEGRDKLAFGERESVSRLARQPSAPDDDQPERQEAQRQAAGQQGEGRDDLQHDLADDVHAAPNGGGGQAGQQAGQVVEWGFGRGLSVDCFLLTH